jgi:hypothetical protein
MSLVLPIVIAAVLIGAFARRITPRLWILMACVILVTITHFYMKH